MGKKSTFWSSATGKKIAASGMFMLAVMLIPCMAHAENMTINASSYCQDNSTLTKLYVIESDYVPFNINCPNGCDNITLSCSPPIYQANLGTMVIIILIIVGIMLLYRFMKR